jgi:hypothetical protein
LKEELEAFLNLVDIIQRRTEKLITSTAVFEKK